MRIGPQDRAPAEVWGPEDREAAVIQDLEATNKATTPYYP
jgi:hypothetical protein